MGLTVMGSKAGIWKPILTKMNVPKDAIYVEPFLGGCNMIEHVTAKQRIGNDNNMYLIALYKAIQNGWQPPSYIDESEYWEIKQDQELYPLELVGYVGFLLSWGGKFFRGYQRNPRSADNVNIEAQAKIVELRKSLEGVELHCGSYSELVIPDGAVVYCDPPYADTEKYSTPYYPTLFWDWCREIRKRCVLYISEYNAPEDFECIWSIDKLCYLNYDTPYLARERLYA